MTIPWQKITKFGQQTMLDTDLFSISWILGRFCNYNCSYCWPYARSDSLDYQEFDIYKRTIDSIKQQANENGFHKFHWSFSGGEPTAYKQFQSLIAHLSDNDALYQSIHLTTNLSPGLKWWNSWMSTTKDFNRRSITASYHDEFADENEFTEKCKLLIDNGIFVTINQVMVPERFVELYDRCKRFSEAGINVTLKPQSNETATAVIDDYDEKMVTVMREDFQQFVQDENLYQIRLTDGTTNYFVDQAERFNAFGFNKFNHWNCNAGYQSVIIRGNEVKRGYSCHDSPLGSLTDGFNLFKESKLCSTNSCVSSADSKIPKWKS
jgi:organic radical activating enzyme